MGKTASAAKGNLQQSPCFTCKFADYFTLKGKESHLSTVRCKKLGIVAIHTTCSDMLVNLENAAQAA